ncbi:MAG TPA: class II aldolase/adducin family protein [Myxococcales bacterium]|nr:class II aldolase/adducin family protein [Myxococcales bacterium]
MRVGRRELLAFAAGLLAVRRARAAAAAPDASAVDDLVAANRILADQGVVDAYGHVSVRHGDGYLLSRDLAPALVTADDVLQFDLDSNAADARGRTLYRERFIHGEIYRARPDVMAIVHDHSPAVVPFSVSREPMRAVFHMAAFVMDGVPVFDPASVPGPPSVLVATPAAGRALAQALGQHPAALMKAHGAVVVGTSLSMAVGRAVYLEVSARVQAQAVALGSPVATLDPKAARDWAVNDYKRAWELWKRKVK